MNSGPFINPIFFVPLEKKSDYYSSLLDESASSIQNAGPTSSSSPSVQIFYGGSGIHQVTATTPLMTLAHDFVRTDAGILLSINHKITLTGKIYDTGNTTSGIAYVLDTEKKIRDFFKAGAINSFEVKCNGSSIFGLSGVRTNSIQTQNSPDFLTKSMDYTVELSAIEAIENNGPLVTQASDNWSIEPLDDYDPNFENFTLSPIIKAELQNPAGAALGGLGGGARDLTVVHIPRFRISHKLMAKGISNSGTGTIDYYHAYNQAKEWVKLRLAAPWNSTGASGAYLGGAYGSATMAANSLFLYNHVRTTSFSITDGTYELTDTWLGMPSGIRHTEDYTIDVKTDEKYIKTVSVQGTIKGLTIIGAGMVDGSSSGLLPSGTGHISLAGYRSNSAESAPALGIQLDSPSGPTTLPAATNSKYLNAVSAWHSGIKPILYRRASAALNAYRYADSYVPTAFNRDTPLQNPIYCKDSLLNIIPVSTSEGHDPRKGIITYNYEFNNKFTIVSGAISETITMDDTGPNDVFAEVFVIGRRLGPILQSLNAKTSSKRTVNIEISVMPVTGINGYFMTNSQCPLYTGGGAYVTIEKIITGLKPFGNRDAGVFGAARSAQPGQVYQTENTSSWNPSEGRYTRRVAWTYQHCNASKFYLDN